MYQNILSETKDNTCIITVNRPDKLNALNHETIQEIGNAVAAAENSSPCMGEAP